MPHPPGVVVSARFHPRKVLTIYVTKHEPSKQHCTVRQLSQKRAKNQSSKFSKISPKCDFSCTILTKHQNTAWIFLLGSVFLEKLSLEDTLTWKLVFATKKCRKYIDQNLVYNHVLALVLNFYGKSRHFVRGDDK